MISIERRMCKRNEAFDEKNRQDSALHYQTIKTFIILFFNFTENIFK